MAGYEPEGEMVESIASKERLRQLRDQMKDGKKRQTPFATGEGPRAGDYTKKESTQFYDWRTQFLEQMGNEIDPQTKEKVTEKNFTNKVVINPKQGTTSN
jgi:hypothetical protein